MHLYLAEALKGWSVKLAVIVAGGGAVCLR